jgi:septum formation protein
MILASASPRRKKLLGLLDIPFRVVSSGVDEHIEANTAPDEMVQTLALRKARDVAPHHPDKIVIGADTIVVHEKSILGKPETHDEACMMLAGLSNSTHLVLTGVALVQARSSGTTDSSDTVIREQTFFESTEVTFGSLDESEIERYAAGGSPMDKAGAYGIQDGWGAIFVKHIAGDYYNIVGLPLHALYHRLRDFSQELFEL